MSFASKAAKIAWACSTGERESEAPARRGISRGRRAQDGTALVVVKLGGALELAETGDRDRVAGIRIVGPEHDVPQLERVRDRIGGRGGMDEHDCAEPLQLREDRIEMGVSQVLAAGVDQHRHAVELEHVEGVCDLFERPFDVWQGQDRERSEPIRTVALDIREELIDLAGKIPRRRVVTEVHARRADRWDRDVDMGLVEVGDRGLKTPARRSDAARGIPVLVRGLPIEVGNDVVVEVDRAAHGVVAGAGLPVTCSAPARCADRNCPALSSATPASSRIGQ
jgi:hypothetical protein